MEHVVHSTTPWRIGIGLVTVFIVGGAGWNAARMLRGDWTWDGRGIGVAVALGLVSLVALLGSGMIWSARTVVDHGDRTIAFSMLGKTEERSLEEPTTVQIKLIGPGQAVSGYEFVIRSEGHANLSIRTPFVGRPQELAALLQEADAYNPGLAHDSYTRDGLDDPARLRATVG